MTHLKLGEPLALHLHCELQPRADVQGLKQAKLLVRGQVGAVPGRVGQRAGLLDGAQEGGDALVGAAELEDLLDHGAVLAHQLVGPLVVGVSVVDLLHLDSQLLAGPRLSGARQSAMHADDGCHRHPVGKLGTLDHLGDDADPAELALASRQEEHALLLADVDRQRRGDRGKDDCVLDGNQAISHH